MNCNVCGEDFLRCNCVSAQPYCEQCSEDSICGEEFPAECVKYHSYETSPASALTCLGISNGDSIEHIVEVIGQAVCNIHIDETPLIATDTSTLDFTTSGTKGHNLTGSVKVSSVAGNEIQILSDGLHVTYTGKVKVSATDALDYLGDQIIGGSVQAFIQNTVQNDANVLEVIPTIDLDLLKDALDVKTLLVQDTDSVDLTLNEGLTSRTLVADVKISAASGNTLEVNDDGLFSEGGVSSAQNGLNTSASPGFVELGGPLTETFTQVTGTDDQLVLFNNTANFANGARYGLMGKRLVSGAASTETIQSAHAGVHAELFIDKTAGSTLHVESMYSAAHAAVYKRGTGAINTNILSAISTFPSFADTGNITKFAGIQIKAPLQYAGETAFTGTLANYYGIYIEDTNASNIADQISTSWAIFQEGTTMVNLFSTAVTTSDERVKTNIAPFQKGLSEIDNINVVEFNYKDNLTNKKIGVIAQQVETILPEAVLTRPKDNIEDFKFVESQAIFYTLLNAVKELSAKVKVLESQLHN